MEINIPLSYDEQIDNLINVHRLIIHDRAVAKKILSTVHYYRLSAYGIGLENTENSAQYIEGTSLEHLFKLYCFDSRLKNDLIKAIERIEITLRTQIAHQIALQYGANALEDINHFNDKQNKNGGSIYYLIWEHLEKEIKRQKNVSLVKRHSKEFKNDFHVWALVELLSFGNLSSLFSILKDKDQKAIAKLYNTSPEYLKSWILCLVEVRNICAHYTRLYNLPLKQTPKLYKENWKYMGKQNKIFPVLLMVKRMLNENEQWCSLLRDISRTFDKYSDIYNLSYMGFPQNWKEIL